MLERITDNPRTTITSIIGFIAMMVATFGGFEISPEVQTAVVTVVVFVLTLVGILAKD